MPRTDDRTDRQLLGQFVAAGEEAPFAVLVDRHGPLVLGLCRRLLQDAHDAEDAFQATFFTLARKAASIRNPEALASWLYGVAYRSALKLKREAVRDREAQTPTPDSTTADPVAEVSWRELRQVIDEELGRLPSKYRASFLLCQLEGKTQAEAARELGWHRGTLKRRVERARDLLRARLHQRGLTLTAGLLALVLAPPAASATLPAGLVERTVREAGFVAAGKAGSVIPARFADLAGKLLRSLFGTRTVAFWVVFWTLILYPSRLNMHGRQVRAAVPRPAEGRRQGAEPRKPLPEPGTADYVTEEYGGPAYSPIDA
jgi:RNA polymerase sigma factor (sigma-70 family)